MAKETPEYYLVDKRVLPEVFIKVMEVKQRINTGESASINEAVRKTGLSRSAYYKYKDSVMPFYEAASGRKVTILISVENFQGILSSIIKIIAESRANISISIDTISMFGSLDEVMNEIGKLAGVRKCTVLSRE